MRRERRILALLGFGGGLFFLGLLFFAFPAPGQVQRSWSAPPEAKTLKNPIPPTQASLAKGGTLYREYCVDCHGPAGKGDGPMTSMITKKPADLTNRSRMQTMTDGEVFWRISKGDDVMPSFEKTYPLSSEDRWHLVNFVRRLGR
jgi:mono/diheme cytochrome c family protein